MKLFKLLLALALFTSVKTFAQLPTFNLQLYKNDETCLGNGSLTFAVSNVHPDATVLYKVYLFPDTDNPLAVLYENTIGSLTSGTYIVEAIQSLGMQSNSQTGQITINNNIAPFEFSVSSANQYCADGGDLIVNVESGIGAQYEIISGPVIRPLQSSNIFNDLPSGAYNIRAFNNCGVGKVKTYTLSVVNSVLNISDPFYPDAINTICDSITVINKITPSAGTITYPLTVKHIVNPLGMSGEEMIINQVYSSGPADELEVSAVLPRFLTESYTYDIEVTDNCNSFYEKLGNEVDPDIILSLSTGDAECAEKYLLLNVTKFTTSYTVNFLTAPEGFDAESYNTLGSGPFFENTVSYGSTENSVPFGDYVVEITDICGRTITESISVEFIKPTPNVRGVNNGCFSEFGRIRISLADQDIVSASITDAPDTYDTTLPQTININSSGGIALNNMPLGIYTITFTDDCGFEYEVEVEVPPFVERPFNIATLPSCTEGYGTIRLRSGNGDLTTVFITEAPAGFNQSLPFNVSANIDSEGDFYMDNLPEGAYTFTATDVCEIVHDMPVDVAGYNEDLATFTFTPNCGAFSVTINDTSNGTEGSSYWLQKFNSETNTWGHPATGTVYTEGSVPTTASGIRFNNNATRNNLNYTGKFRIVKKFETFGNGTSENTICVSVLDEFTYTDGLSITSAYTLACIGQPNDVYLEVAGHPVSYKITRKNGENFVIDNGADNVFADLEPAEYRFRVEDECGNVVVKDFNVQSLPSIADATQPLDMIVCTDEGNIQDYEFHLTDQNAQILGPLFSAMYTITYHLTLEDADAGINPLPDYYTATEDGQTIYARLIHNEIELCYGITSFQLFLGEYQEPVIVTGGTICNDGAVTLTVAGNYVSYLWSNGATTKTISVSEPGNYTVIVEKAYGSAVCDGFAEVTVDVSETPEIISIDTKDWTDEQNMITIHADGIGEYIYSIDGVNYQESNVFEGLDNGVYQVYVKDINGCGEDTEEVVLLNYPKFFTPNGDGVNETWQIKYSIKEPNMTIAIYDRYGKLITNFGTNHVGWDGTLKGTKLPSTDYWFVVTREDGREFRGHFSMIR